MNILSQEEPEILKVEMIQQYHEHTNEELNSHKDLWWKLMYTLFTLTAVGYLAARRKQNLKFHLIKPFPVLILGYVVLLWCSVNHGRADIGDFVNSMYHFIVPHNPSSYAIYVSVGLFLSAIGDLCLIFDRYFVHGILFFLTAHLSFILAFTAETESLSNFFTPLIVVFLVTVNIFFVYVFVTKITPLFIANTPKAVIVALFFYIAVIVTMCYTASVKALSNVLETFEAWSLLDHAHPVAAAAAATATATASTVVESGLFGSSMFKPSTLYALCGAFGAVLFFLSDIMILIRAINGLKNNQVSTIRRLLGSGDLGMITYWLGQFCIALSVTSSL
ncbi:transmembrane protein [Cavenderia fasciculata]|uniref:Transmembrane protein n=1 Tax=Cavenderia fasciculata TaxID=261658 RepID=F4QDL0_CACFS|nr:uncharacterized protein DFA_11568 [Cavenderia fasciculata]EGG13807.1 transmembrane protein [Cavenderia fasciculata]|eukprot:XP_004350515.1 transmembrane protein [Cavenderia fasciculata]